MVQSPINACKTSVRNVNEVKSLVWKERKKFDQVKYVILSLKKIKFEM